MRFTVIADHEPSVQLKALMEVRNYLRGRQRDLAGAEMGDLVDAIDQCITRVLLKELNPYNCVVNTDAV